MVFDDDPLDTPNPMNAGGYIPARRESRFALGLDVGQSIDPSAIAIVERVREPIPPPEGIGTDLIQRLAPPVYHVRWLERLPLQTPYPAVVAHVGALLARPPLYHNCRLVLDRTGVGRAIGDLFAYARLNPVNMTITAGDSEHQEADGSGWRVSKIELVSRLQAELHSGALKIAKSLPEAAVLASELSDFRANISDSGYASFGARTGRHDDLVLSLAIAVWYLMGPRGMGWSISPLDL